MQQRHQIIKRRACTAKKLTFSVVSLPKARAFFVFSVEPEPACVRTHWYWSCMCLVLSNQWLPVRLLLLGLNVVFTSKKQKDPSWVPSVQGSMAYVSPTTTRYSILLLLVVDKLFHALPSLTAGLSPRIRGYSRTITSSKNIFFKAYSWLAVFPRDASFKQLFRNRPNVCIMVYSNYKLMPSFFYYVGLPSFAGLFLLSYDV